MTTWHSIVASRVVDDALSAVVSLACSIVCRWRELLPPLDCTYFS